MEEKHTPEESMGTFIGKTIGESFLKMAEEEREQKKEKAELLEQVAALTKYNDEIIHADYVKSEQIKALTEQVEKGKTHFIAVTTDYQKQVNDLIEERADRIAELSRLREERKEYNRLLKELIGFIDSGYLVRDISEDHKSGWAMKQFPFLKTLAEIKSLLDKFNDSKT